MARQAADEVVKSERADEAVNVRTADIQERFKFFETYKEPEQKKKEFRITPPRDGQVKVNTGINSSVLHHLITHHKNNGTIIVCLLKSLSPRFAFFRSPPIWTEYWEKFTGVQTIL